MRLTSLYRIACMVSATCVAEPQLLFRASFDSSATADFAKGSPNPVAVSKVTFEKGLFGGAARFSPASASAIVYALPGNVAPERGAVSMWIRRSPESLASKANAWLFSTPGPFGSRIGTGSLYFWLWTGDRIRGDNSNAGDLSAARALPRDDAWHHVVFDWDRAWGPRLHVDGVAVPGGTGGHKPMKRVLEDYTYPLADKPGLFDRFFVGSSAGHGAFDGWIDDLRIYSAPLGASGARRLRAEAGGRAYHESSPDYAGMSATRGANPYEASPLETPGVPGKTTLVREWRFDGLPPDPAFRACGPARIGNLGGTAYIEAGDKRGDRFAVTFDIDDKVPLHVFEFDYPDDRKRTMDLIVQEAGGYKNDYAMQVGVLTGDDIPVSGRIRTHRCVYWTRPSRRLAFVAMTARDGGAAALSAVRLYRVDSASLPAAAMKEPAKKDGWGRTMALYYEDAAVNYDFSVADEGATPEAAIDMADRLAATMKYTGQNLFAYPAVWYDGLIGRSYNPRRHAPDFLSAFYERFDREGLGVMPLINQNSLYLPDPDWFTLANIESGAIHATPVSISSNGLPKCHITLGPAEYNIAHPVVRAYYSRLLDILVGQGARHPSFKGVGLHLKYSSIAWFGNLEGGYNDYCIESFEKATGVKVPVDRKDPARGRLYAEWLLANERERWIKWRCDVCTGFWIDMAAKLAAARKDLKLWINDICVIDASMDGFRDRDYMRRTALEGGLDALRIAREAKNVILGQTTLPADYRTTDGSLWYLRTEENREYQRTMHLAEPFWDFTRGAAWPAAHQHDRYWEDAVGNSSRNTGGGDALAGPGRDLDEHDWRVSTLNYAGEYAMAHFAEALMHGDKLVLSKGGYLIGTYGMEDVLAPFAQAFRSLPPLVMKTLPCGNPSLRIRRADYDGKSWFYIVNVSKTKQLATLDMPEGAEELPSGRKAARRETLELPPYALRSFSAREGGTPLWVQDGEG